MEPRLRFNIDHLLKQKNLKASDLSKITGIPKQTISEWRSGLVPKSVVSLKRVASAFGVSLDELVFRMTDDMPLPDLRGLILNRPDHVGASGHPFEEITPSEVWAAYDHKGYFSLLAPALEKVLGWDRVLLLHRPVSEFIYFEDWERFSTDLNAARENKLSVTGPTSYRLVTSDFGLTNLSWQHFQLSGQTILLGIAQADKLEKNLPETAESLDPEIVLTQIIENIGSERWNCSYRWNFENLFRRRFTTLRSQFAQSVVSLIHNALALPKHNHEGMTKDIHIILSEANGGLLIEVITPFQDSSPEWDATTVPQLYAQALGGSVRISVSPSFTEAKLSLVLPANNSLNS